MLRGKILKSVHPCSNQEQETITIPREHTDKTYKHIKLTKHKTSEHLKFTVRVYLVSHDYSSDQDLIVVE